MEQNIWTGERCEHQFYIPAGYKEIDLCSKDRIRVQSLYDVFCLDCKHYIDLLTGERPDDKNLVHMDEEGFIV